MLSEIQPGEEARTHGLQTEKNGQTPRVEEDLLCSHPRFGVRAAVPGPGHGRADGGQAHRQSGFPRGTERTLCQVNRPSVQTLIKQVLNRPPAPVFVVSRPTAEELKGPILRRRV